MEPGEPGESGEPLRVLVVEDSEADYQLMLHALQRGEFAVTRSACRSRRCANRRTAFLPRRHRAGRPGVPL